MCVYVSQSVHSDVITCARGVTERKKKNGSRHRGYLCRQLLHSCCQLPRAKLSVGPLFTTSQKLRAWTALLKPVEPLQAAGPLRRRCWSKQIDQLIGVDQLIAADKLISIDQLNRPEHRGQS
jgi:hypothetical protein